MTEKIDIVVFKDKKKKRGVFMTKKRLKKDEKEGVKITKTCLLQKKKRR